MKTKTFLLLLLAQLPLAHAQTQWVLQPYLQYFGHVRGSALGARVKGFVGSKPNNPYNIAVASSPSNNNPTGLSFYSISTPQDTTPLWIIPYGADVEDGDFNGDGYTDFAVWKSVNMGRNSSVLIYLGDAAGIDTVAAIELTEEQERSGFGLKMCIGDLNNDGNDDLVITAPGYAVSLGNNGKVYAYFGDPNMNSTPDFTITGSRPYAGFGSRCAIGDFNDDGFNDLAIRGYDQARIGGSESFGYLNIYLASAQVDTIADLTSPRAGRGAGTSGGLAAFDANADDKTDLLWTYSDSLTSQNFVYIHFGGADFAQRFQVAPDFVIPAPFGSGEFGNEIANAGDMNGDGDEDILIAAYSTGQENGIVFVYTAGKALDDKFDAARGQSRGGNFGASIDGVGDVNHDGYDDIIVGAPLQPWSRYEGYFGIFWGDARIPTHVAERNSETPPADFILGPIYPNPLTSHSTIEFKLSKRAFVETKVYNLLGKEVIAFPEVEYLAGQHRVVWNSRDRDGEIVPSGIYFVRMRAFASDHSHLLFEQTNKFMVVR
ncbi:FG-GAP repeat protein [candidate division KSB1 bacterium]|nr:FG-GAP-like repeat-containing protein [bacterium]NUM66045.1 FG-GAP repeat protein [candidate division KSB1 bacterium]